MMSLYTAWVIWSNWPSYDDGDMTYCQTVDDAIQMGPGCNKNKFKVTRRSTGKYNIKNIIIM